MKDYNITDLFIAVTGKKDFYASGKSELVNVHLSKIDYKNSEMIFIGDTIHDMEIANQIGCDYFIVSGGHQDVEYASNGSIKTISDLGVAVDLILNKT